MTGTYRFRTAFYGLTEMPLDFQKALAYILNKLKKSYSVLDYILIVSKGSVEYHKQYAVNCLKILDEENLRSNLLKCHIA